VRIKRRPTAEELATAVRTLVAGLATAEAAGRPWIVQAGRIREYRPDRDTED